MDEVTLLVGRYAIEHMITASPLVLLQFMDVRESNFGQETTFPGWPTLLYSVATLKIRVECHNDLEHPSWLCCGI